MSDWNGSPLIEEDVMVPIRQRWRCPDPADMCCGGEMVYTGMSQPTGVPGHFHKCDSCGFTTVLKGELYPRTIYRPALDREQVT